MAFWQDSCQQCKSRNKTAIFFHLFLSHRNLQSPNYPTPCRRPGYSARGSVLVHGQETTQQVPMVLGSKTWSRRGGSAHQISHFYGGFFFPFSFVYLSLSFQCMNNKPEGHTSLQMHDCLGSKQGYSLRSNRNKHVQPHSHTTTHPQCRCCQFTYIVCILHIVYSILDIFEH